MTTQEKEVQSALKAIANKCLKISQITDRKITLGMSIDNDMLLVIDDKTQKFYKLKTQRKGKAIPA
jgi:hypothetical protein